MKKIILICNLILYFIAAKGQMTEKTVSTLDSILSQYQKVHEFSGFSIGIIKGDNFTYLNNFGKTDINKGDSINSNSVFHIASLSKNITATAIMTLVEKGKLNLDDKLYEILPYFKLNDDRYKLITIKHILLHTSGIRDIKNFEWDNPKYEEYEVYEYLKSIVDTLQLDFTPGEKDRYSNLAFDFLADVISTISGVSFEEYIQINILKPLEMDNSTFIYPDVDEGLKTSPHILGKDFHLHVSKIYPYNRIHAPSSTMQSTIEDMMKWARFNLQKGSIGNNLILSEQYYNELTKVQKEINPHISFGLSWAISPFDKQQMIYNSGGDVGYRSFMAFIPNDSIAIVTLSNCEYFPSREIAFTAINIVKGKSEYVSKKSLYLKLGKILYTDGIDGVKEEYHRLSKSDNQEYNLNDVALNDFARQLINQKRTEDAIGIMKFNIEVHPESAFCYENIAGLFKMQKNYQDALTNYKKALELRPNNERIIGAIDELEHLMNRD